LHRRAVIAAPAAVAIAAMALRGIIEYGKPAQFLRRELCAAGQVGIVLAAIGIEVFVVLLVDFERFQSGRESLVIILDHGIAKDRLDVAGIGGLTQPRGHRGLVIIRHFEG
jgi:hypothetical protein